MLEFLPEHREAALSAPHGAARLKVLEEAWTWLFTPWRHMSREKGSGVDCGNLVAGVFANAGLIQPMEVLRYPEDFYLHSDREIFLEELEKYCSKVSEPPLPADIVGFKLGRPTVSHIAIVLKWPQVIHSIRPQGKVAVDDIITGPLQRAYQGVWRLKEWCD